jgi:hypothetical protein
MPGLKEAVSGACSFLSSSAITSLAIRRRFAALSWRRSHLSSLCGLSMNDSESNTSIELERFADAEESRCRKTKKVGELQRSAMNVASDSPVQLFSNYCQMPRWRDFA